MKNATLIIIIVLYSVNIFSQQVVEPNYGLALSASGMSVFTFGVTMKPSLVVQQYNPQYGHNYVRYDSIERQRIKSTTLICGALITITVSYFKILNIKKIKRNEKTRVSIREVGSIKVILIIILIWVCRYRVSKCPTNHQTRLG